MNEIEEAPPTRREGRGATTAESRGARLSDVPIGSTFRAVAEASAGRRSAKGLGLWWSTSLPTVRADAFLVREALEHLMDGVIRLARPGAQLMLTVEQELGKASFVIGDEGTGEVDVETLDRCRRAMEAQGGRLSIQPNAPTGRRICLRFTE